MISQVEQNRREVRANFWTRVFWVAVIVFLVFNSAAVTFLAVQDHQRIQQNREIQGIIRDCVQPTGKCYQAGQEQRRQNVAEIQRRQILTAACAPTVPTGLTVPERATAIRQCVDDLLR